MYPEVHQEETWEQRCGCIATLLCCRQQVTRRPDGKRPPLKNIAELTAGLLSHVDLEATDIAAAIILTSAAQQRRRRLRIAKALMPVYRALREGQQLGGGRPGVGQFGAIPSEFEESSIEEGSTEHRDSDTEDGGEEESRRDSDWIPSDPELTRTLTLAHATSAALPHPEINTFMATPSLQSSKSVPVSVLEEHESTRGRPMAIAPHSNALGIVPKGATRFPNGRKVTFSDAEMLNTGKQKPQSFSQPNLSHLEGVQEESSPFEGHVELLSSSSESPVPSLDLTESNLAALDTVHKLQETAAGVGEEESKDDMTQAAASLVADEVVMSEATPAQAMDQLAAAIQEEVERLGECPLEEAVLSIKEQESLDLSTLKLDPEKPTIWFNKPSSGSDSSREATGSDGSEKSEKNLSDNVNRAEPSTASHESSVAEISTVERGSKRGEALENRSRSSSRLSIDSSEAAATLAAVVEEAQEGRKSSDALSGTPFGFSPGTPEVMARLPSQQAEHTISDEMPPSNSKQGLPHSSRPLDKQPSETFLESALRHSESSLTFHSAVSAQSIAESGSFHSAYPIADGSSGTAFEESLEEEASSDHDDDKSHKVPIQRQITLQYPAVITPSEHVENFQGPLSPEALAEIYAGRHESVPTETLKFASSFLRYAYAAYSLQPSMESPSSFLDICCFKPPDPQAEVFRGLGKLGEIASDEDIELLHINCSNRVLAHLPYLIALDHAEHAVVIALRGTIGVADLVTDAVVYPEDITHWLPEEIAVKVEGPALAHAGMVSAAKAVFQDMEERGILRELIEGGGRGGAPEHQAMKNMTGEEGGNYSGGGEGSGAGPSRVSGTNTQYNRQYKGQYSAESDESGGGSAVYKIGRKVEYDDNDEEYRRRSAGSRSGNIGDESSSRFGEERSPGSKVGDVMRKKVDEEGWKLVVVGHSLGAGAAALISLKLRQFYPELRCLAFSCPGALVSKNLSHAMGSFCTTIAAGKDVVPRATVPTMARLMDELITSLARCKQPKMRVLFAPWWRRHRQRFKDLFYDYKDIPPEAAAVLIKYYESRRRMGQPVAMYPPGKIIFLRPIKSRRHRHWDAVFVAPEDLIGEGILVSPTMLKDHLCSTVYEALGKSIEKAEAAESGREEAQAGGLEELLQWPGRAVRAPWRAAQGAAQVLGRQPKHARQSSLQQALINAV